MHIHTAIFQPECKWKNIYGNHKALIFHIGCSYYYVITQQKE